MSRHVISQNMKFIRLAISQPFLKVDFWFGLKYSINLYAEHFTTFGVIKYISGHMTGHKLFFYRKVPLHMLLQLFTDRNIHIIFHLAPRPLTLDDLERSE